MNIMRSHVNITKQIFGGEIDETIQNMALRHHEKLDGSGYPLGLTAKELTIGERIVAVADIVSALSGTRSYKDSYSKEHVLTILNRMKQEQKIDGQVTDIINQYYDEIIQSTQQMCEPILDKYQYIRKEYKTLQKWCTELSTISSH